jgi:crotonobetainyl-CoA:carnitine CoA-transferase CaiB-like acyl-CoA transferase
VWRVPKRPRGPLPALGADTDEVLADVGYTDERVDCARRGII